LPGVADAATVSRATDGTVNYVASNGETNFVTVSEPVVGTVAVRDVAPVRAGSGCVAISATEARCSLASRVDARLGDRSDTFVAQMGFASVVDAGSGDDQYFHSGSAGLSTTRVDFRGSTGVDTASYSAAAGAGVIVNKDGLPNDGRTLTGSTTIDRDNIRADVENLIGTGRNDVLIGAGGTGTGQETYHGLGGDDVMLGNGGNDHFDPGTAADGADRMVGGNDQHFDSVGYGGRNVGVAVSADDGLAMTASPASATRSSAWRACSAPPRRHAARLVDLHPRHADHGRRRERPAHRPAGGDNIFGEAGVDTMFGNDGADSLRANDGQRDNFLDCGSNPADFGDLVVRDGIDPAGIACESAQIGRLRLNPEGAERRRWGASAVQAELAPPALMARPARGEAAPHRRQRPGRRGHDPPAPRAARRRRRGQAGAQGQPADPQGQDGDGPPGDPAR
jgi:RTX calcium-binding nonapeptide repeat (4 copies)